MKPIDQKGQASIFILAFIGVVLVCTIFLYQSGRITSEKMQLQNAADAAAFSASTLEARSLNFCAYTNRAMVANEVGIGQLIGLLSLVDEVKTIGSNFEEFVAAIEAILNAIPVVGNAIALAIDPFLIPLETIGAVLNDTGAAMEKVMARVASPLIRVLSTVNEVYSYSQMGYHGATIFMVTTTLFKTIEKNVPGTAPFPITEIFDQNRSGAHLSDLGILAMAGHIPSFWNGYTKTYKTGKKGKNKGMQRMAATIRNTRDIFSSGAAAEDKPCSKKFTPYTRDWHVCLDLKIDFDIDVKLASVDFWFEFKTGVDSQGAAELRFKEQNYLWSAVDTSIFVVDVSAGYWVTDPIKDFGGSIDIGLDVPTGGGGYQAAGSTILTLADMGEGLRKSDPIPGSYGYRLKEKNWLSWKQASLEMEENNIDTYKGLAPYRGMGSTKPESSGYKLPFVSPYYLVGVVRNLSDIHKSGPQFGGNLDILEKHPKVTEIGAIAKSEVYYKRPTDLSYFLRSDKKTERPNMFGPFWQARLSKTSDLDRFLALAIQHQTIWLAEHDAKEVPGLEAIKKELESLSTDLNNLLKSF